MLHHPIWFVLVCGLFAVTFLLRKLGTAQPTVLPPPGGPETLGPMRTLPYTRPISLAPDAGPVPPDSGPCAVSVVAIAQNGKIHAIQCLREVRLLCDLSTAKALSENLPQPLFRDLPAADAERVRRYLAAGGVSVKVEPNQPRAASIASEPFSTQAASASPVHDQLNGLERLEHMKQNGVLTDAEFTRMKAEILGQPGQSGNPFQ